MSADPRGSGRRGGCLVAALGAGAGSATASWWLVGNLSVHSRPPEKLDYAYRAPTVPGWIVPTFGVVAVALLALILGGLVAGVARGSVDRRWLRVACGLALAGFLFAGIGRVVSAGVIGANIGAGLAVFFGLPLVLALVVACGADAVRAFRSPAST